MVAYNASEYREILLDPQRFAKLAQFFIEKSSQLQAEESGDPLFGEYIKNGLETLLQENLKLVFELTGSPIETIFVNALVLDFIKSDPLNLVVQHSVRNAPKQIERFRENRGQFKKFMAWYTSKHDRKFTDVDRYLHRQLMRGKMDHGEHHWLLRHWVFYEILFLENRFHMVIQPGLPDVRVEGRTIRPDLLFWVPSDEKIKIVVECDGFQYHGEKVAFIHDRKRDRALKAEGYEVLRFSGTEIHNDPIGAADELGAYLQSIDVNSNS